MRKIVFMLALLVAAAALGAQNVGDAIRFFSEDLDGAPLGDGIFAEGRITMLNVWGTFCGPCLREMPDLARLGEANRAKGMQVVGIPLDIVDRNGRPLPGAREEAAGIIARTGAGYRHVVPTKEMLGGFLKDVQVVPTTIFVDRDGTQVGAAHFGAKTEEEWQRIIDDLLEKSVD